MARLGPKEWRSWGHGPAGSSRFTAPRSVSDSGWISALVVLKANTAVAVLMLLVALLFTGIAVLGIVMLKRVGPG